MPGLLRQALSRAIQSTVAAGAVCPGGVCHEGLAEWPGLRAADVGVAVPGLIGSGCGGGAGADGKIEIRHSWWGGQGRATLINKAIALFEKKHPNIKVKTVKTDFHDYGNIWKNFNTQASAGNAPDVFQNSVAFLRTYGDKRVLLDLNSQVKAGNLGMENFRAGLEKAGGPVTTVAGSEADRVYTNDAALYGLAAIENLALVGDRMPA